MASQTNGRGNFLERFFRLAQNKTTVRIEIMAGITTFFASAFTILAIPGMIGQGDSRVINGVFFAACLSAAIGTLMKSFFVNIPFVQAPGMGLGSFFAFTAMPVLAVLSGNPDLPIVQQYQMALALVFISGVIFALTAIGGVRERIIDGVPRNIKVALGSGIGLFITLLGLRQSGLVVGHPSTIVALINFGDVAGNQNAILGAVLALIGLFVIVILSAKKIKGSILIGIILTAILAYVTGHTPLPESFSFDLGTTTSDFFAVSFFRMDFMGVFTGTNTFAALGTILALVSAFVLVNMLDALGTIFGIASAAGMVDDKGEVVGLKKGMTVDAIGTAIGAVMGSSSTATVVSSASGIAEGGRTGLTSFVTGILFFASLFLAPFVSLIPLVAIAPALIFVGCLMMSQIKEVDFRDITEAFPAFLTIAMMPLTFSIANGISFGLISYIVIKLFTGRIKEVKPTAAVIAGIFILQFVLS